MVYLAHEELNVGPFHSLDKLVLCVFPQSNPVEIVGTICWASTIFLESCHSSPLWYSNK
jgi:hypothetical protein